MNQSKTKLLRSLFEPPFPSGDIRNRTAWRLMKKRYNKLPSGARYIFLRMLEDLRSRKNIETLDNVSVSTEKQETKENT